MYSVEELKPYKVKQLKLLADYEGIKYPKNIKKAQLIDILVQLELPLEEPEAPVKKVVDNSPCSVRIRQIRDSKEN